MPNIIHPISDPDEIRAAQAAEVAERTAQVLPSMTENVSPQQLLLRTPQSTGKIATQASSSPTVPAGIYPEANRGVPAQVNQAAAQELIKQPKQQYIGIYIIVGFLFFSAVSTIFTSQGSTIAIAMGFLSLAVGLGLLGRYELARTIFIVVTGIDIVLSVIGLLGLVGYGATIHHSDLVSRLIIVTLVRLVANIIMVYYLTRRRVKALFA